MHLLIWLLAACGLALWTLLAWGVASLFGLDLGTVGDLRPVLDALPFVWVLDASLPGWRELLLATLELAQTLLAWAGTAGAVVVWVAWGVGAALIVGGAGLLSLAVALLRRGNRAPAPQAAG
jgi:hypothetical protein